MLSRTIGSLCRNTTMSLNEGRLNCSENTNQSMMKDNENVKRRNSDSEADQSDEGGDQYENGGQASAMTVFKKIFKKYKKKRPLPDLTDVIDPHEPDSHTDMSVNALVDIASLQCLREKARALGLKPFEDWKIATFRGRNGLFILPGVLTEEAQVEWTKRVFKYPEPPHTTNMTIHGTSPERFQTLISSQIRNLAKF
ncbi:unnamed protein product [Auanema sp. JU1783]|nr:unnamed protein product [Auanema sp. JU1783]